MHNKFEINQAKIKGSFQSGRKVVTHNSKSDLPLGRLILLLTYPDGHSDLASLMPKNQLSINIPVD